MRAGIMIMDEFADVDEDAIERVRALLPTDRSFVFCTTSLPLPRQQKHSRGANKKRTVLTGVRPLPCPDQKLIQGGCNRGGVFIQGSAGKGGYVR